MYLRCIWPFSTQYWRHTLSTVSIASDPAVSNGRVSRQPNVGYLPEQRNAALEKAPSLRLVRNAASSSPRSLTSIW